MVTDTEGYIHIIEYLTEHLSLFEHSAAKNSHADSVMATIEEELSNQIITVCSQNTSLTFNLRNTIIREVDAIVYDLEEILSSVMDHQVTPAQVTFIKEFSGLIKNLFDSEIHQLLNN
ncbi:MAG: DUF3802 family protein [Colwellia sp.]|nr:DUF3802 family protein [Colwellia sp.]